MKLLKIADKTYIDPDKIISITPGSGLDMGIEITLPNKYIWIPQNEADSVLEILRREDIID